jgi:MoaA/NifB/PqqE/SkfB family radical SAM enzyme
MSFHSPSHRRSCRKAFQSPNLFSSGEPTVSPDFLEALAYARQLACKSLYMVTNGIRFALEPELDFAEKHFPTDHFS